MPEVRLSFTDAQASALLDAYEDGTRVRAGVGVARTLIDMGLLVPRPGEWELTTAGHLVVAELRRQQEVRSHRPHLPAGAAAQRAQELRDLDGKGEKDA